MVHPRDIITGDFKAGRHGKGDQGGSSAEPLKTRRKSEMAGLGSDARDQQRHEDSEATCRAEPDSETNAQQGFHGRKSGRAGFRAASGGFTRIAYPRVGNEANARPSGPRG